jgi:hypothetical protein
VTPVEGQWLDLRPTMFIQAADGTVWRVTGCRMEPFTLDTKLADLRKQVAMTSATTGQTAVVSKGDWSPVTILVPDWDEPHLVAALQGVKYRKINAWSFPKNTPQARFEVATHMLLMHRMSVKPHSHKENGPLSHLLERHAIDHAAPANPGWSPHIHVPRR